MSENEIENSTDWSEGLPNGFHDDHPPQPPSIAQAFLKGLLDHIKRCRDHLQQTYLDVGVTAENPAMKHYMQAMEHLNDAQHRAMSVEPPLAQAMHRLELFMSAVGPNARIGVETPSGPEGPLGGPVQRLRALLVTNKNNAMQLHAKVVEGPFWHLGISEKYVRRAELLESTFDGNGDERAVVVLLEADTAKAEAAFQETSWEDVGSELSGAGYVHRAAMLRLFKLKKKIEEIAELEI